MVEPVKAGRTPEELAREFRPDRTDNQQPGRAADRDASVRHERLTTTERGRNSRGQS